MIRLAKNVHSIGIAPALGEISQRPQASRRERWSNWRPAECQLPMGHEDRDLHAQLIYEALTYADWTLWRSSTANREGGWRAPEFPLGRHEEGAGTTDRHGWRSRPLKTLLASRHDSKSIPSTVFLGEPRNAFIIADQRTGKFDRRGNQKPISRVAVFKMVKFIAAAGGPMAKRHRLDARAIKEALNPFGHGNVEFNPTGVNEQRNLPCRHGAQKNGAAVLPAPVDEATGRRAQALVATVEPQSNVRVEQNSVRHRSSSRPVSASGSTSRTGATKSTPS